MSNPKLNLPARSRLIFAMDLPTRKEALQIAEILAADVGMFKIGLELYLKEGNSIIREIHEKTKLPVFLDLKLHDIPVTVARAIKSAGDLPVKFLTIHASGGQNMIKQAVQAASETQAKPTLLGVTMLTSLSKDDLNTFGYSLSPADFVNNLVKTGENAGLQGFVASAKEIESVRSVAKQNTVLVIPGIRPEGVSSNDQKRTATPYSAVSSGADYIVVGRAIRDSQNPAETARSIVQEISSALERK